MVWMELVTMSTFIGPPCPPHQSYINIEGYQGKHTLCTLGEHCVTKVWPVVLATSGREEGVVILKKHAIL